MAQGQSRTCEAEPTRAARREHGAALVRQPTQEVTYDRAPRRGRRRGLPLETGTSGARAARGTARPPRACPRPPAGIAAIDGSNTSSSQRPRAPRPRPAAALRSPARSPKTLEVRRAAAAPGSPARFSPVSRRSRRRWCPARGPATAAAAGSRVFVRTSSISSTSKPSSFRRRSRSCRWKRSSSAKTSSCVELATTAARSRVEHLLDEAERVGRAATRAARRRGSRARARGRARRCPSESCSCSSAVSASTKYADSLPASRRKSVFDSEQSPQKKPARCRRTSSSANASSSSSQRRRKHRTRRARAGTAASTRGSA